MGKLNAMQQRFIEAYAGNATEAALAAGYSPKTAEVQGCRLLKNVNIAKAIRKREAKAIRSTVATRVERQEFWSSTMRDGEAEMRERLKASELLGRSEGDFLDKHEITGNSGGPVVFRWQRPDEATNDDDN
jgi:phage terminase small subunit